MNYPTASRRHFMKWSAAFGTGILLSQITSCTRSGNTANNGADWESPPDLERAREQAKDFVTYGMPDDWANYGEVRRLFAEKYGFELNNTDTDMSSLEEITKFDAEKNNPRAICADIGLLYGVVAEARGVVPPYLPEKASVLPDGFKSETGGWVATYAGVPSIVVNADVVQNIPQSWEDLLKPEYKGKIAPFDPTSSGTAATSFIAMTYAQGGDEENMTPGVAFAKALTQQFGTAPDNAQTLEKGEAPIQIKYDFNSVAAAEKLKAKGIKAEVIIPGTSIYAPSALMLNKYNTAKMDVAKLFMDFVLSDEAQTAFAKFGARPIRYVVGDMQLPESAKANWLPEAKYAQVKQVKDWRKVNIEQIAQTWQDDVLGG
ncbi:MAG: extracellular solute-binding protein [Synechococcales cyanobacterium C42_A2020_086]|nr:extracellular solute-binding protein [Synechococcales cyanobacterium C42_A2020_086]